MLVCALHLFEVFYLYFDFISQTKHIQLIIFHYIFFHLFNYFLVYINLNLKHNVLGTYLSYLGCLFKVLVVFISEREDSLMDLHLPIISKV